MGKKPQTKAKKHKPDWRRIVTIAIAAALVLALALPLLGSLLSVSYAATQSELKDQISGLKGDAQAASARKKELEEQLAAVESDKARALERKQILDQQLANLDEQISNTQSQINTYAALITEQEAALEEAKGREQAAYELFCQRARAMEEAGEISYWSVLFQASSYADLLDRLAMVDQIVTYDNSVVETLAQVRGEVEETLASLNETKTGLDEQKAALDAQRSEQAAKVEEAQTLFDELKSQADKAEALVAAEEAEEEKIAKQIAAKEKELEKLIASQQVKFTTGSGYVYPLPSSCVTVTSMFGPRIHPITGKPNNHTGTDIAAPGGTSIYAVQGGVVQISAYAPSSYGEYVVINHGNGMTTLYAHMRRGSRLVKEGDVVSQGQTIGYVGMTGSATGNHLHLELRLNGVRQDALTMFPGVNFDIRC